MWLADLLTPGTEPPIDRTGPAPRRALALCAVTLAVGTTLLWLTLHARQGSGAFVVYGVATAAAWVVGALCVGPVPLVRDRRLLGRTVAGAVVIGGIAFCVFALAYQVARHVPVLSGALDRVLGKADAAPKPVVLAVTLLNGLAEEIFFRGALVAGLAARRPALLSGLVYVAVTAATGNVALVIAAVVMGTVFGLERRATGGVLVPAVTHLTWSTLMLLALPR